MLSEKMFLSAKMRDKKERRVEERAVVDFV
jgi:hypothetical protein